MIQPATLPPDADSFAPRFPFARLHLRRNPFGSVPPEELAGLIVPAIDLEGLASWLKTPRRAVQFVAPCGHGKTSHLLALQKILGPGSAPGPITRIEPGEKLKAQQLPPAPVVFLDESQRLAPRERAKLLRRGCSFALGTHERHDDEFIRLGLAFRTVEIPPPTVGALEQMVDRRLAWARWGEGKPPRVSRASLESLLQRHGGDLRALGDELYDRYQARVKKEALDGRL